MAAVGRRQTGRISGIYLTSSLLLFAFCLCTAPCSKAQAGKATADFYTWLASEQGQKASLAQMQQQCDNVSDAGKNLDCSVSVFARMFEAKAANQIPDYYLAIKRRHAQAIAKDPELNALFSMFGSESIAALRSVGDFSVTRSRSREELAIHPYARDGDVTEEVFPYIDVSAANGASSRFIVDTGAPQTRVNIDTAKRMGITLLSDSHYGYSTFYGEHGLSAKLGIFKSLKIGGSEFRNVLVFVSDRDNLLGLDLIGKLGRLKVTKKTLVLNAEPPERCDSHIMYARMDINLRLTIAARLDRQAISAIIDTGNVDYLTSAAPGNQPISVVNNPLYQTYRGELSLSGHTRLITYKYYPDFTIPPSMLRGKYVPSILFGWRSFDDYELNLDLDADRSCFNRI
ncbi:retropepsin-like aspartic protease [Pseudomonas sp. fls2-241-R2A-110]|uniref:retropepsin-like aspartic protease n=1 Tax=Pseudomonas sp. fls2-241-R2A-110 TaxID=3040311 RepID=UPI002556689A|nr:retropepsin-like aspartic protease [Pseudomonas sp. fls2-241-R2A-110]